MELNESAKVEKGGKAAELAHTIDRKRKQLNQNLVCLIIKTIFIIICSGHSCKMGR